eukprot:IDg1622t1
MLRTHESMWFGKLGTINATHHRIEVPDNTKLARQRTYRAGPCACLIEAKEISRQLCDGIIKPLKSVLTNAPATFQRALDIIFSKYNWQTFLVYLDDIIVFSRSHEEHIDHVDRILTSLETARVSLKLRSCNFFTDRIKYLGHIIRAGKLEVEQAATASFRNIRHPRPLPQQFPELDEAQARAYQRLIEAVTDPPVLALPKLGLPFSIDTDACDHQIGCALFQTHEDGNRKPIGFWSRTISKAEKNYGMPEKECLAVIYAIQICRPYVQGEEFTVHTDCSALRWLFEINDPSGRLMRWRLRLAEYRFKTEYRKGIKNCQGDAMSRLASGSHTTVDIDEEIPAYSDDLKFEADLATDWHDDELVPLDVLFATTERLPEAAEPLLIEEIFESNLATNSACACAPWWRWAQRRYIPKTRDRTYRPVLHQPQQIVVPETLRLRALNLFHRPVMAGHPGGKKMYTTLRRTLYWPGMALDCYQHVRSCPECARERVRLRRYATELQLFPPSAPLDSIAMDLLGPFPSTKLGNTHLLVITDRFTK